MALLVSGCLPSSCSRNESRSISAADSLSRAIAAEFPVDTLVVVDRLTPGSDRLAYPRTIGYAPDGTLWVTDTARHILLSIPEGRNEVTPRDTLPNAYPYLAGFRGASVFAFSPSTHRIYELTDGTLRREIELEGHLPEKGGLRYAVATESGFAVKVVAPDFDGYLAILDRDGRTVRSIPLSGPEWRYAGLLRATGDEVYSLAGYLPLIDTFHRDEPDSLALIGFDSPMLARTLQFRLGDTNEPPLLSSSAVMAGGYWFVLNMRPGWIQIDVYSLSGDLRYLLTQPDPEFNQEFFPTDLAVHALPDGGFHIAVAVVQPEPRIDRFYWHP